MNEKTKSYWLILSVSNKKYRKREYVFKQSFESIGINFKIDCVQKLIFYLLIKSNFYREKEQGVTLGFLEPVCEVAGRECISVDISKNALLFLSRNFF